MSTEITTEGVERWLNCQHAISQITHREPAEGFNDDYSCKSSDIVKETQPQFVDRYYSKEGQLVLEAVELYPDGFTNHWAVEMTLGHSCANCPFYKPRNA